MFIKIKYESVYAAMKSWAGGIVGLNKGCVEKCVSSGKITVTQAEDAGSCMWAALQEEQNGQH